MFALHLYTTIISNLSTCFCIRQQLGSFYPSFLSGSFHDLRTFHNPNSQDEPSPGICWNTPWKLWPFGTGGAWPCEERWISGSSPRQFWWPRTPSMERGEKCGGLHHEDGIQPWLTHHCKTAMGMLWSHQYGDYNMLFHVFIFPINALSSFETSHGIYSMLCGK